MPLFSVRMQMPLAAPSFFLPRPHPATHPTSVRSACPSRPSLRIRCPPPTTLSLGCHSRCSPWSRGSHQYSSHLSRTDCPGSVIAQSPGPWLSERAGGRAHGPESATLSPSPSHVLRLNRRPTYPAGIINFFRWEKMARQLSADTWKWK